MSLISLFTKHAPQLGDLVFDAVLEETFELEVEWTEYPVEFGADVPDHGIVQPRTWSMIGVISNTPLTNYQSATALADFTGLLSNFDDSGELAIASGISAGFLAGSDEGRAKAALDELVKIVTGKTPITVSSTDITLPNMVINSIRRVKDPENENALIVDISMRELNTIRTINSSSAANAEPLQFQLREGDASKSQASQLLNKGLSVLEAVAPIALSQVTEVLL